VPDIQQLTESVARWRKGTIVALAFSALAAGAAGGTAYLAFKEARQIATAQGSLAAARAAELSGELDGQRERTAKAEQSAAEAEQRAAGVERKAEEFQLAIAGANERAAEAYRELSELDMPRTLTPDARRTVSDKLKTFAGTQFDVALNPDTETQNFLLQLEDILTASGWKEVDWVGTKPILTRDGHRVAGVVAVSGVVIQMRADQVSKLKGAADALAAALQVEGISASAELGLGIKNDNTTALHVLVGKKPLPAIHAPN